MPLPRRTALFADDASPALERGGALRRSALGCLPCSHILCLLSLSKTRPDNAAAVLLMLVRWRKDTTAPIIRPSRHITKTNNIPPIHCYQMSQLFQGKPPLTTIFGQPHACRQAVLHIYAA